MADQEQGPEQSQEPGRQQLSFTWKGNNREVWQPAFQQWAAAQPKGQQAAQDYILHLIRIADRADEGAGLRDKLDALGLKALSDAHYARMAAESALMSTVADLLAGAK